MKRRILWSIVAVSAVAVVVLGIPLGLVVGRLYRNEAVLRLEREASETRRVINAAGFTRRDPVELTNDGPTQFAFYSAEGRRMAGRGPERADAPTRHALRGVVSDQRISGRIVVAIPVDGNERVVGALRASGPESVAEDRVRRAWLVIGTVAGIAIVISALLARGQARRLTRPIDALVGSAERLGAGDFGVRAPRSGVAELDELGGAMDATAERLGGLLARERAFSADASHQLRTPIAALRVAVESTLMTPEADARATLRELLNPIDRLEATVDDLLELARDTHTDRSALDLTALLAEVRDLWHGPLAGAGRPLRIEVESHLDSPLVSGSAVHQILEVLLANALRHGTGIVTVRARRAPGAMVIDVVDEGGGVADTHQPFVRRSGEGHGIGLSLARTLAEAEGGRLVLDRAGPGPVFSLILPVGSA